MIRVTVELYPHGHLVGRKTLGTIDIINVRTTQGVADYECELVTEDTFAYAEVEGHIRNEGWLRLLKRVVPALEESDRAGVLP